MNCPNCEVQMIYIGGGHDPATRRTVEDYSCPLCGFEMEIETGQVI